MVTGKLRDLPEQAEDRSPAFLPELLIDGFESSIERQLHPWCDTLWQASSYWAAVLTF